MDQSRRRPQTRRVVTPISNSGLLAGEVSSGAGCAASEHRTRGAGPPAWEVGAGCPPQHEARPSQGSSHSWALQRLAYACLILEGSMVNPARGGGPSMVLG